MPVEAHPSRRYEEADDLPPGYQRLVERNIETLRPEGATTEADGVGNFESMTREELYELAQDNDISGRSNMDKDQLVAALRDAGVGS